MAKPIKIDLDLNTKEAQASVKSLNKELQKTDDSLEDVESAGKAMARAIDRAADDTIDEIERTKRAVDALEKAFDDVDFDAQQAVGDLKKLGLTAEDIEQDADELAAALKRIDDVKVSADRAGFKDLNKVMGETESGGKGASAAIGGIGGSISELPGIGALGPIAESVGQLSEGALEGEVSMKQLLSAGLALGAVAFVMQNVNKHFENIAKVKAFNKARVESYVDALEDADSTLDAIVAKLEEAGGITENYFGGEIDLTAGFTALGVSVDDAARLIDGGKESISAWAQQMLDAGVDADTVEQAVYTLNKEVDALEQGQKGAAVTAGFLGESQEDLAKKTEALAEQTKAAHERLDELIASMVEAAGGAYDLEKADLDLADSIADLEQAYKDNQDVQNDGTKSDEEKAASSRALREQEIATAEQALANAQAYATEKGAVDGSAHSARLQVERLQALQSQYPQNAAAIQPYIDKLLGIPGVVGTTISADTLAANKNLDDLITKLAAIGASTTTAAAVAAARFNTGQAPAPYPGGRDGKISTPYPAARGGSAGGTTLVGEEGPELVDLPSGSFVTPASQTRDKLRRAGSGGNTTIIQNFPRGTRPEDVINAQRYYERTQGPL